MAKIDNIYHNLLNEILHKGFRYEDPNRKGVHRIQIPSYTIEHDFVDGFPAITTKKLYWKGVVGELILFLRGDTNIKYLVDNDINIWNKDAYNCYLEQVKKAGLAPNDEVVLVYDDWLKEIKEGEYLLGDLRRVYGAQWRDWNGNGLISPIKMIPDSMKDYTTEELLEQWHKHMVKTSFSLVDANKEPTTRIGIDQISNLIKGLKENPMGTRHMVTAWNPAELDEMALPPCHWSFEVLVEPLPTKNIINKSPWLFNKDGVTVINTDNTPKYQFTLKWHQRSVDTFLGLPFNIASYALLAQIIGRMTNMVPKGVIGDLSNVHIYEPHLDAVKEQLSRNTNEYQNCELETDISLHNQFALFRNKELSLDEILNEFSIGDFVLKNYESYPVIKADMLAYNK
jgi:thymidylate synthase